MDMIICMAQILVEGGNVDANMARAKARIVEAAKANASIVVLPECMDLGWTFEDAPRLARPIPGERSDMLAAWAKEHRIHVVAGLTERDGDRIYNSAILIDDKGELLLKHRKINELDIAHHLYALGDRMGVADTRFGKIGIDICADNFPSSLVLGHALARMGARIILSPSAWAVDANHDNKRHPYGGMWKRVYSTLAKLYDLYVIGVSNVGWITSGPWKGKKCIGNSIAVGPGGKLLAHGPHGVDAEALVIVHVRPVELKTWGTGFSRFLSKKGYRGI
ncbi:MAG: carbon-nitrogen hydrolase family protein [Candidatus Lokiarchaeota archaeon]|nr:carbon-nitrogen hydrolase family protein [Candidatus Lokiarchaeota archaeon]